MPTYDMRCTKCGHKFEVFQGMNDKAPVCPKCKGKTEHLITNTYKFIYR